MKCSFRPTLFRLSSANSEAIIPAVDKDYARYLPVVKVTYEEAGEKISIRKHREGRLLTSELSHAPL